jgi:hypothetical protein
LELIVRDLGAQVCEDEANCFRSHPGHTNMPANSLPQSIALELRFIVAAELYRRMKE